jgi:hypothetical protein
MAEIPDSETCYLMGLLLGGGEMSDSTFTITLPLNKWGATAENQTQLSRDFLLQVRPKFERSLDVVVDFNFNDRGEWIIFPMVTPSENSMNKIQSGLRQLGLPVNQALISTANLSKAREVLPEHEAEHFLSGIFDARASVAMSHRRFTDAAPIVSIEIPGKNSNFRLVVQLCAWLTDLGSVTDQVLYNHPSFHASLNPDYKNWQKGFKIRLLAGSFLKRHSFAMDIFAGAVTDMNKAQTVSSQGPCALRQLTRPKVTGIHEDIDSTDLPIEVRDKIFLHYFHVCATMKCPHAPTDQVNVLVSKSKELVSAFPLLIKSSKADAEAKFNTILEMHFPERPIEVNQFAVEDLLRHAEYSKYPKIKQAVAYLFSESLNGKRPKGPAESVIENVLRNKIYVKTPDIEGDAPLLLFNLTADRGVIVSNPAGKVNEIALDEILDIDGIDLRVRKIKGS